MNMVGNHLKMHLPRRVREQAKNFYVGILGCRQLEEQPYRDLDLYEFSGGFVLGLFFVDDTEALTESDHLKATWMEIKTDEPRELEQHLRAFGVREIDFADKSRFYFQAPGGQVFRVAPMDGEL